MALVIIDGPTIPQNKSLSEGVDCTGGTIVRITVPQEFTDANLTFQASSNGEMYNDLYNADGQEIELPVKADTTVIIDNPWTRALGWIKIRSGPRDAPVPQRETCKLAIAIEVPEVP